MRPDPSALLYAGLGGAAIIAIAALWLCWTPLAYAGECRGTVGVASFYGSESGNITASGRRFNPNGMTAAHRSLPFGTVLTVTDILTGRSVRVTVTDRGPAAWTRRTIDLARGAAQRLGMIRRGTARVCITR